MDAEQKEGPVGEEKMQVDQEEKPSEGGDAVEGESVEKEPPSDEKEVEGGEEKVDTLQSLADLKNRMETMSREELEEALKNLPTKEQKVNDEDGRTTPIHLRDIVVPIRSLTDFVDDKRVLYKQIFRTINKKEFKRMLPKYLRVCQFCKSLCLYTFKSFS